MLKLTEPVRTKTSSVDQFFVLDALVLGINLDEFSKPSWSLWIHFNIDTISDNIAFMGPDNYLSHTNTRGFLIRLYQTSYLVNILLFVVLVLFLSSVFLGGYANSLFLYRFQVVLISKVKYGKSAAKEHVCIPVDNVSLLIFYHHCFDLLFGLADCSPYFVSQ